MMDITGDLFIGARVPAESLRAALARALKMDPSDVRPIEVPHEDGDKLRAFIITVAEDSPGDYPGQYVANVDSGIKQQFFRVLNDLAQGLHAPVLTGAGDDDPGTMRLSLPDGTAHHLYVEQDDDGGIRNTPEMRRLIAVHSPAVAAAS